MIRISQFLLLTLSLVTISLLSCRKDGMHSEMAGKIQYRWERFSFSTHTTYLDGSTYTSPWSVKPVPPGEYIQYDDDGYFYTISSSSTVKYQYAVDGNKIMYLHAGNTRATTPQYGDTAFVQHVDDHLLVLYQRSYFLSPAYSYVNEWVDSLKR